MDRSVSCVNELALDVDTLYTDPSPGPPWDAIDQVIVDDRDALLLDALSDIHRQRCEEPVDVAVIHGAAHMPAVIYRLLARHGYRARTAEWVTVFDIDDRTGKSPQPGPAQGHAARRAAC
jgi:hypothetical protein